MGQQPAKPRPELDDETIAFAQKVFGYVRTGHAEAMIAPPPWPRRTRRPSLPQLLGAVRPIRDHEDVVA